MRVDSGRQPRSPRCAAIEYCLRSGTPFLGTCGGFQYACVALARALAGLDGASHGESDPDGRTPVIVPLACSLYGERRLIEAVPGTRLASICGTRPFHGVHWCGWGLAGTVERRLRGAGVVLSAYAADAGVEAIELADHPFFLAAAFQPQVGSSEAGMLHPLIAAFRDAARTVDTVGRPGDEGTGIQSSARPASRCSSPRSNAAR